MVQMAVGMESQERLIRSIHTHIVIQSSSIMSATNFLWIRLRMASVPHRRFQCQVV